MTLGDVESDRPRLEQGEITLLVGRDLIERMPCEMSGLFYLRERQQPNIIRLTDFFKRPPEAHIARRSMSAIGPGFKCRDDGTHWATPLRPDLSRFGPGSRRRFDCGDVDLLHRHHRLEGALRLGAIRTCRQFEQALSAPRLPTIAFQ